MPWNTRSRMSRIAPHEPMLPEDGISPISVEPIPMTNMGRMSIFFRPSLSPK